MSDINQRFWDQWKTFEKIFGGRLPSLNYEQMQKMMQDPQWVEKFVQDILNKTMPNNGNGSMFGGGSPFQGGSGFFNPPNSEVFETHRSVIARIKVSDREDIYGLRLSGSRLKLKLDGIKNMDPVEINLPAAVNHRGTRARYKDGVLEVRMPKETETETDRPIRIHFE
ncbi:hypothetical protein [Ferviditalea candida]|uniref:Hsp20/alpha crystallin family protein n=1 Tax=Ferviditalea candida TaxID=3108399 RepID=A0ABU5ZG93_9BACL|nr:Hsp20/alpha crystallin family protein [Paenibacillaceae bacterium T2]